MKELTANGLERFKDASSKWREVFFSWAANTCFTHQPLILKRNLLLSPPFIFLGLSETTAVMTNSFSLHDGKTWKKIKLILAVRQFSLNLF